ncbi:hypothetical protein MIND_01002700 [Mycena indigotica]|uniref:Uncharacterized protein n=1 Tax=Mycena indigotica TaxID=2126181 RepID=A0A8H6VUR1_9AGAR|nr:uncharacterized protein MIND_01002700 [Mycena indigotica]KAF7294659.1 hypothetical protein MIND_01002700 [Mycena indigotica]
MLLRDISVRYEVGMEALMLNYIPHLSGFPPPTSPMLIIEPQDYLSHLILWNAFQTCAAVGNSVLFIVNILSRNTTNLVLLNLTLAFIIASISFSILAWSGHALNQHPPFEVCLWSGVIALSNVPLIGASALALSLKVWAGVMMTGFPAWRGFYERVSCTPLLLLLPIVSALPVFCAGLVIGLKDRSIVYRGSPMYCVVNNTPLQYASLGLGAVYSLTCLCFAIGIVIRLLYMRWRICSILDHSGISYSLILRTLLFSVFVGVAVVANMVSFTSTFAEVMPDVVFLYLRRRSISHLWHYQANTQLYLPVPTSNYHQCCTVITNVNAVLVLSRVATSPSSPTGVD